jgi:hypothetical protein
VPTPSLGAQIVDGFWNSFNMCFPLQDPHVLFLGLLDPYPLVRSTDPDRSGSGSGSFPFLINVLSGLK